VPVARSPELQMTRLALPVVAEEDQILHAINVNDVLMVSGETGSGKTTQIPQFLYEAGYASRGAMIGITQPRRVAAVSMAARVRTELQGGASYVRQPDDPVPANVGHQVRYDNQTNAQTHIKFMTEGILLKELSSAGSQTTPEKKRAAALLLQYSVIILDEVHERTIEMDWLLGWLSRIVYLRNYVLASKFGTEKIRPLKLVLMSATLSEVDEVTGKRCIGLPLIKIPGRQFPVTLHHNRKTPQDPLIEAARKIIKIHQRLPAGGILCFVTGKAEIFRVRKANKRLSLKILPLYAQLPKDEQQRIFDTVPPDTRVCVIATNVAETSLTIPHIRYIVDAGQVKRRVYDMYTGASRFEVGWTSQNSAQQRAGRAGRVGPGHCYRLYSSAVFNNEFPPTHRPEILERPIEDVLLKMKELNIENVEKFPYIDAPSPLAFRRSLLHLEQLGALAMSPPTRPITSAGQWMARFPIAPRMARFLWTCAIGQPQLRGGEPDPALLPFAITLVAAVSVGE
ncbi:hypothetical protein CXG81DRAFT_1184, partial [Caulochytrium protostelioides]